ncbi:OmpA family protein [Nisaea acidiphila]|uniref:OmpA family protein n=1 Tax=Nisaea acidiphila TaxID=1862145 RepID=A0A9J7AR46_9PROT|nr:OmpA family protein [Nisaea acidiphila]UUX49848.1 OmpA family protein [Nisaea acidiphila]
MPDALNPVEWYEDSTEAIGGWFSDEDAEKTGDSGAYPNVGSVPEKPTAASSSAERSAVREQLVADRENAQYDDSASAASVADASATSSVSPGPAPSTPEPIKPIRMTATDEATKQVEPEPARNLPSRTTSGGTDTAQRSSLWPNAPVPDSAGDRAVTSAQVGDPVVRSGRPSAGSTTMTGRSSASAATRTEVPVVEADPVPNASADISAPAPEPAAQQVASVPETAPEPVQLPEPSAGTVELTPPSGEFNFSDPSVIVDESALPGEYGTYAGAQGGSYQAGIIRFSNGSARLSSADQGVIRELVPLIRDYNATVEIVGHASSRTRNMDPFEHKLVNFEISLQRANAVAAALINAGAPSERISVQAVGDSQPVSSEAMPAGEADNRRAEIYLIY